MEHTNKMYSITEIIEMSGLGRTKIYEEIGDGYLRAKKIGARTVIPAAAYTDWVNNLPDYLSKKVNAAKGEES